MNKWQHTLGVLGGAGALASAHFHRLLISIAQSQYRCDKDEDFPDFIAINHPWRGLTAAGVDIKQRLLLQEQMHNKLQLLRTMGCSLQVIVCNSLYGLWPLPNGTEEERAGLIMLPSATMVEVRASGVRKCGLMASKSSIKTGIYQEAAGDCEIVMPTRWEQNTLEEIIDNTLSSGFALGNMPTMREIARAMIKRGAEGIILGCTELSPLLNQSHINTALFDSSYIAAKACLARMSTNAPRTQPGAAWPD